LIAASCLGALAGVVDVSPWPGDDMRGTVGSARSTPVGVSPRAIGAADEAPAIGCCDARHSAEAERAIRTVRESGETGAASRRGDDPNEPERSSSFPSLSSSTPSSNASTSDGALARRGAASKPIRTAALPLRSDAPGHALQLFDVFERPDDPVVAVAGYDAGAPRRLTLWQVDDAAGEAAVVARLHSLEGGGFAVERLLLSVRGVRLVVAADGADPFGPEASLPIDFAARPLLGNTSSDSTHLEE
jgi:hypothetical protein